MKRSVSGRADIKHGMARLPRFLFPLSALLGLPLACSSEDPPVQPGPPVPPVGGSNPGTSGSGGGGALPQGGSSGAGGSTSGGSSMSGAGGGGGTVPPGGACTSTAQCQGTGFKCNTTTKVCDCSVDKPDTCGEAAAAVCTQKMTDPQNCGTCGMACAEGAACVAGACGTAPTELLAPVAGCGVMQLAIQGANIYWTESMSGKVRMMPLAGGAATDIATGQVAPGSIVADATGVYWVQTGDGTAGSSKVMKLPIPATGTPVVLKAATTTDVIHDVAVGAGKLYYSLVHDVHQISTDASVTTDIIVGTAVDYDVPVVKGGPHGVAVNATAVAWTCLEERAGIEADDLLEETGDPLTTKTGYHELAQSVGSLRDQIEVDATYAYWVDAANFVRNRLDAAMPIPDAPIVEATSYIKGFAINATDIYMALQEGHIVKHSIGPGAGAMASSATPIAIDQTQSDDDHEPGAVVLDATKVYWATSDCAIRSTGL